MSFGKPTQFCSDYHHYREVEQSHHRIEFPLVPCSQSPPQPPTDHWSDACPCSCAFFHSIREMESCGPHMEFCVWLLSFSLGDASLLWREPVLQLFFWLPAPSLLAGPEGLAVPPRPGLISHQTPGPGLEATARG